MKNNRTQFKMKIEKIKLISYVLWLVLFSVSCGSSNSASMIAVMEIKEPIEGVCDQDRVISILPFLDKGQVKAIAPKSKLEIQQDLNTTIEFLQSHLDYEDEGMVSLIINCKGELVQSETSKQTQNSELDKQILVVFSELKEWTPGKLNYQAVDTVVLYSFKIENSKVILN